MVYTNVSEVEVVRQVMTSHEIREMVELWESLIRDLVLKVMAVGE